MNSRTKIVSSAYFPWNRVNFKVLAERGETCSFGELIGVHCFAYSGGANLEGQCVLDSNHILYMQMSAAAKRDF